jgi:hypothetical protein
MFTKVQKPFHTRLFKGGIYMYRSFWPIEMLILYFSIIFSRNAHSNWHCTKNDSRIHSLVGWFVHRQYQFYFEADQRNYNQWNLTVESWAAAGIVVWQCGTGCALILAKLRYQTFLMKYYDDNSLVHFRHKNHYLFIKIQRCTHFSIFLNSFIKFGIKIYRSKWK